jgi:tetratricopeptide (TPR) repeat protein
MIRFLVILICAHFVSTRGETVCDTRMREGMAEFSAAFEEWDAVRFEKAANLFRQSATNSCASVTNFYWLGTAQFHLMLQLTHSSDAVRNRQAAADALDEAIKSFSEAVKLDPKHAEGHALLATLYGMKIGDSFLRAGWFGPRIGKHHDAAVKFGKDNPRIVYLTGMCEFHTAKKSAEWREALTTLLRAEKLFDAEAQVSVVEFEPRWGRSSCLTFIGKAYEKLSETKKALEYFERALEAHPQDHLAKEGLERLKKNENK